MDRDGAIDRRAPVVAEAPDRRFPARPILAASCAVIRDGKILLAQRVAPPPERFPISRDRLIDQNSLKAKNPEASCDQTGSQNASVWSFPGGVVEAGERLQAAALRELAEETGVSARIIGLAGWLEHIVFARGGGAPVDSADPVLRHYVIMCFAAIWTGGEAMTTAEAPAVTWATVEDARRLPVTDGLLNVFEQALVMGISPN